MSRRWIALAALLCLLARPAGAACGFGTTFGSTAADSIQTGFNTLTSGNRTYSIWAWYNASGGGGGGRFFDASNGVAGLDVWLVSNAGVNMLYIRHFSSTDGQWSIVQPSASKWHHYLMTYTGTSTTPIVYVDGVSVTVSVSSSPVGTIDTTAQAYMIGNRLSGANRNYDGKLAQFSMWSDILTAADARALAQGASPLTIHKSTLLVYVPCYANPATQEVDWGPNHLTQTITGTVFRGDPPVQPYPGIVYGQ